MNQTTWTTADEILWLDSIGKNHVHTREMAPAALLARYLEGAARRRNWANLDRQKILRYAVQRHARLLAA
jgi:nicotinic acid mononucleotide adenylyltransferase